jgi:hypothetical protein
LLSQNGSEPTFTEVAIAVVQLVKGESRPNDRHGLFPDWDKLELDLQHSPNVACHKTHTLGLSIKDCAVV